MDTVSAGFCAKVNHRQAHALGFGIENLVRISKAHGHGVDQIIAVVSRVEIYFAA